MCLIPTAVFVQLPKSTALICECNSMHTYGSCLEQQRMCRVAVPFGKPKAAFAHPRADRPLVLPERTSNPFVPTVMEHGHTVITTLTLSPSSPLFYQVPKLTAHERRTVPNDNWKQSARARGKQV